jgi:hypothetical protein
MHATHARGFLDSVALARALYACIVVVRRLRSPTRLPPAIHPRWRWRSGGCRSSWPGPKKEETHTRAKLFCLGSIQRRGAQRTSVSISLIGPSQPSSVPRSCDRSRDTAATAIGGTDGWMARSVRADCIGWLAQEHASRRSLGWAGPVRAFPGRVRACLPARLPNWDAGQVCRACM